jgi:flagellar motor switch protein FliG
MTSSAMAAALDRRRKAAIVVQLLLADGQKPPLSVLPEEAQVVLARAIGALGPVDRGTVETVVAEFAREVAGLGIAPPQGTEGALAALGPHISPAAARRLRAEATGEGQDHWAEVLALPLAVLLRAAEAESVEVAAVLLSKLPVGRAADLLGQLPGERARRIAHAVSSTADVPVAAVRRIGAALAAEYGDPPPPAFSQPPGERLGAILNSSREEMRTGLLAVLETEDGAFAAAVRRAIFTFPQIPQRLRPADVPRVLRGVEPRPLVQALAAGRAAGGAEGAAVDFLLGWLPQRMAESLREEMASVGSLRRAEGEAAQAAVVAAIRRAEAAGEIVLVDPEEEKET